SPAELEGGDEDAVGGADGQQVHHGGLGGDDHGAEGEQQQQEAERDHDQDLQQQLARDAGGEVGVGRGGPADVGAHVGALLGGGDHAGAQRADQVRGGLLRGAGGGDRVEERGGPGLVDLNGGDRCDARGLRDVFLQRLQPRVAGAGVAARRALGAGRALRTGRAAGGGRGGRGGRGLGGRAERYRDEQRPIHPGPEVVRDQVVRPAGSGRRGQRGDVLLP